MCAYYFLVSLRYLRKRVYLPRRCIFVNHTEDLPAELISAIRPHDWDKISKQSLHKKGMGAAVSPLSYFFYNYFVRFVTFTFIFNVFCYTNYRRASVSANTCLCTGVHRDNDSESTTSSY